MVGKEKAMNDAVYNAEMTVQKLQTTVENLEQLLHELDVPIEGDPFGRIFVEFDYIKAQLELYRLGLK